MTSARAAAWGSVLPLRSRTVADGCAAAAAAAPPVDRYRAVFISDVHLGSPGCRADALVAFLRRTECDLLYLVGDIVEGFELGRRRYWHPSHDAVVEALVHKVRDGTAVVYIPGNHDEDARRFVGGTFGGIAIREDAIHVTSRGLSLWVTHGDGCDDALRWARWIVVLGATLHAAAIGVSRRVNAMGSRLGFRPWPLSRVLAGKVRDAVSSLVGYEDAIALEARRRGVDGVVCGHVHKPEIRDIGGILYCNDGDWVESLTALVETDDGDLRIARWPSST